MQFSSKLKLFYIQLNSQVSIYLRILQLKRYVWLKQRKLKKEKQFDDTICDLFVILTLSMWL